MFFRLISYVGLATHETYVIVIITLEKMDYIQDENGFRRITKVKYYPKENGGFTRNIF